MLMESLAFNHQDICIELFTSQKRRFEDALWEKNITHISQLILLVQTMEIFWDNKDTKCLRKLAGHQMFKSLSALEALLLYLAWLFKHKMQNETQLDASLKGGSAFLGSSDNWMVTPAAEHLCCHPRRLQRLDATRRGHPGWQRHNSTKAFRSQSQLVEDDRIKNSHIPLSHCHPCRIGEKYPWAEKKKQLDASTIDLYNRPTVWYYLQNNFNWLSSDKYTFSDTKSVTERSWLTVESSSLWVRCPGRYRQSSIFIYVNGYKLKYWGGGEIHFGPDDGTTWKWRSKSLKFLQFTLMGGVRLRPSEGWKKINKTGTSCRRSSTA